MHDFAIFKGNCPPQEDVALVNSLTYFAHYRHEPELKDKLMDIFIRSYENNYVLRSDFDFISDTFPGVKKMFEDCALEFVPDEVVDNLKFEEDGNYDIYSLFKTDAADNDNQYYFTYLDFLMLFESEEYDRTVSPKPIYAFSYLNQMTMRAYEKYESFLRCLYSYLALPPQHRKDYIIFIPNSCAPVQLLEFGMPGSDPFNDDYPKGIKVNPGDFLVYNWDYSAYAPDFYAIQQLFVSREVGDKYLADPETKTYAIQISKETYEYAKKRLNFLKEKSDSADSDAEFNLLSDIVEAYFRDHEKFSAEHSPLRVGPSTVEDVPAYWTQVKLYRILKPKLDKINEEVKALNLGVLETDKLIRVRVHKLIDEYIQQHSRKIDDDKIELTLEDV